MTSSMDEVIISGDTSENEISLGYSAIVLFSFQIVEVEKKHRTRELRSFCDGQIIREKCLDLNLTADIEEAILKSLHTNLIISLCNIKNESISIPEESVLSYVSCHGEKRESSFKFELGSNQIPLAKIKVSEPQKKEMKRKTSSLKKSETNSIFQESAAEVLEDETATAEEVEQKGL
ncbi:unnamed protein product [Lepeophtheirus salmonis]|uniref:(salmon louse) hypothetical protein n=1 Tax=Lepeophtheirus salmonis TaxID=72036 RepID=A0A7R8H9V1_LEPSM|nr:unnamed protein product [Lepeophtheirus salmonis]CAF2947038.1 unnamed protein product [Lepeophtheirus salmonis]